MVSPLWEGHPGVPCHPCLCPPTLRPLQGAMSMSSQPRGCRAGTGSKGTAKATRQCPHGLEMAPPALSPQSHSQIPAMAVVPWPGGSQPQGQGHRVPPCPLCWGGGGEHNPGTPPPAWGAFGAPCCTPSPPQGSGRPKGRAVGDNPRSGTVALPQPGPAVPGLRCPSGGLQSS